MSNPIETYIEEVALFFEQGGLPRISGRILGFLLVCDPPHRSFAELAEEIGASKGSISTMTRMLLTAGLIEKVAIPGSRATYVRLKEDGWETLFAFKIQQLVSFRPLADKGLTVLAEAGHARSERLRTMRDLYAFFEQEMPALLERWRASRTTAAPEEDT